MARILMIEDTPEMQRLYQLGLERSGHTVDVVGSAGEGLTRIDSGETYDVVLLDLMLMGMSGLDFLKQSQVKTRHPQTKLVVLTNVDNAEIMERVKAQGVDEYIVKANTDPLRLAKLLTDLTKPAPGPAATT
ncbi:MAG TPA: response regulator [Candidatus Saccharimonadia bacterium]